MKWKEFLHRIKKINYKMIMAVIFLVCVIIVGSVTFPFTMEHIGLMLTKTNSYYNAALTAERVDKSYQEMLDFDRFGLQDKGFYINLYGLIARIIGQRYINERIKLDNGHLTEETEYQDTWFAAVQMKKLYDRQKEKGKDFLFIMAPNQVPKYRDIMPAGYVNVSNGNADELIDALRDTEVPALDLRDVMYDEGLSHEEAFFVTDHHWKPETGLWSIKKIIETLTQAGTIGPVDPMYTNIEEYDVEVHEKIFLGSFGRRTGVFFAGIDDFSVITPRFETDFSVYLPYSETEMHGSFRDMLIDESKLEVKFFESNPYVVYGHAEEGLIQYRNENAPVDLKVLAIGDSFSHVSYIWLPLIFKTCDQIDMRYIEEDFEKHYADFDPDIVLVMVNPKQVVMENTTYDFFNENILH